MKGLKKIAKNVIVKYGSLIACCAFACVAMAANSACFGPFYEIEEPEGLEQFKKIN